MPAKAPTYYHWSQDKPCTTNQVYGFQLRDEMVSNEKAGLTASTSCTGTFAYTRPFSNLGFLPDITHGGIVAKHINRGIKSAEFRESKKLKMNEGYTVGYYPIHERVVRRDYPADVRLKRFQSAPTTYRHPVSKEKNIYLWHTLSGCLVHVKNPNEQAQQAQIAASSS